MIEHAKRHDRIPDREQPITEVRAERLDEDGRHAGWLVLTPNWIVFLDSEHDKGHHDDYIAHTRYQGAEVSGDDELGALILSWSDQGKVYEGNPIELATFKDAVVDQLNP